MRPEFALNQRSATVREISHTADHVPRPEPRSKRQIEPREAPHLRRWAVIRSGFFMAICALSVACLAGCASLGTVLTGLDLEMRVDSQGAATPSGAMTYSSENPLRRGDWYAYDVPSFRDEVLGWRLGATVRSVMSFDFESFHAEDVVLRWDRAQWRSSAHPAHVPLHAFYFATGLGADRRTWFEVPPGRPPQHAPFVTLKAGDSTVVDFRADSAPLFPASDSDRLFGIRAREKGFGLIDNGVGRWLELELPVESGSRAWTYIIRLGVRAVPQWVSYF